MSRRQFITLGLCLLCVLYVVETITNRRDISIQMWTARRNKTEVIVLDRLVHMSKTIKTQDQKRYWNNLLLYVVRKSKKLKMQILRWLGRAKKEEGEGVSSPLRLSPTPWVALLWLIPGFLGSPIQDGCREFSASVFTNTPALQTNADACYKLLILVLHGSQYWSHWVSAEWTLQEAGLES